MLILFAASLTMKQTVIEKLARIKEPDLDAKGVAYCRNVTKVWCVFFIINGSIALYTALFTSLEHWMLYNGFISYMLMGLLMAVEYIVRLKVKKKAKQGI